MLYIKIVTPAPSIIEYQKPKYPIVNPNITKNMRDVKTKYTVSKENLENVSASTPECHIKNIASNAVKGIPISKAAIVALRWATILTVATRNPLTITFSTNSIIL